ncbi:MAG: hypothetical protein ACUVYA_16630, partial [Planctomycetota bacterium]
CGAVPRALDIASVRRARLGFEEYYEKYPVGDVRPEKVAERGGSIGSIVLGEAIAIFPGLVVPGLGHFYAGDNETATKLLRIGQTGYLFAGIGAGLCAGGYFLDEADEDDHWNGVAYGLYAAGGLSGVIGVGFLLSAWVFDIVDTPRAVSSGGQPPPRTPFVESMDIFD